MKSSFEGDVSTSLAFGNYGSMFHIIKLFYRCWWSLIKMFAWLADCLCVSQESRGNDAKSFVIKVKVMPGNNLNRWQDNSC